MWIVRTITGKRGLRRDWKNISDSLCRLRLVRFGILRVIARKHPHRRVSGSHAGGGKTYFLLVVHPVTQGPEVYGSRCVNYLGRLFTHGEEGSSGIRGRRRLRDGVAVLLGDGQ